MSADVRRPRSAGKLLSKYSDRLMSLAADALSAMKDLQNVKTGQMFIGASQTTGVYILPRLIREQPRDQGIVVYCRTGLLPADLQWPKHRACCSLWKTRRYTPKVKAARMGKNIATGIEFWRSSTETSLLRAERFKRKHPEVTVQLQVENTRRCCQAVTRGHVDIAIVGGEIPHDLAHLLQARHTRSRPAVLSGPTHASQKGSNLVQIYVPRLRL